MDSLSGALALVLALLFTSSGPGPVGFIDQIGSDQEGRLIAVVECPVGDSWEMVYVDGTGLAEGDSYPCETKGD